MKFLLMFIFIFSTISIFSQDSENMVSNRKFYKGGYSTKSYTGISEYSYLEKQDGSRIYDGSFSFQGEGKEEYVGSLAFVVGSLMNQDEEIKIDKRIGKTHRRRINIKGEFVNGLKEGKWIYIIERYNDQLNKYLPTDSTVTYYKKGHLNGLCTYVYYGIYSRKKIKEERVDFEFNSYTKAIVFHYNNKPVKYESNYRDNKPLGVWIEKRNEGIYSFDFQNSIMTFLDVQTGQKKETTMAFFSFPEEIKPFKHGFVHSSFWKLTIDDCYDERIGDLYIGDYFVEGSAVINQ